MSLSKCPLLLLIAAPQALAGHWSSYEGRFDCPEILNSHKCARHLESNLDKDIVRRSEDDQLIVVLSDGTTRKFDDDENYYAAIEHLPTENGLVISEQWWEGGSYGYLDLEGGWYQPLSGYPLFSENARFVLVTNTDLDAGYSPNVLQIWQAYADGLHKMFDAEPGEWGPLDAKWISETDVSFVIGTVRCALLNETLCTSGTLTFEMDHWSIQLEDESK